MLMNMPLIALRIRLLGIGVATGGFDFGHRLDWEDAEQEHGNEIKQGHQDESPEEPVEPHFVSHSLKR